MNQSRIGRSSFEIIQTVLKDELSNLKCEIIKKGTVFYTDSIKIIIMKSGFAKLSFLENGEEFIIYTLKKDNLTILNEISVLEILEDSEIYMIDVDDANKILKNEAFKDVYIQILTDIVLIQRNIMRSILYKNAKSKVASFLVELALEQNLKQNGFYYVFIPFSMQVLSSFVGLRRQSASTEFNKLIKENIIKKVSPQEILILDFKKLQEYAAD